MNTEKTIAKNIRIADDKAGYDAACKRLLSEKIILAWIMQNCLKEYLANSITRYSITEETLVGNVKEPKANYDLMTAIMICLGKPDGKDYAGVLKLLDVLLSSETSPVEKCQILEEDFQIEMTQTLESEVSLMCNLSKGVEEKGFEKGIEKGKIYGAISMCQDLGLPESVIIKKLQEKFHLSEEEVKEYLQNMK